MNSTSSEVEGEIVNGTIDIIKYSLGFVDALTLQPVQDAIKFWVIKLDRR